MRTREEQASVLMQVICDAGWKSSDAYDLAIREILEAERRAEQRVRAEIGRDSERLDWLASCLIDVRLNKLTVSNERCRYTKTITVRGPLTSSHFRKAIDAAREVG